MGHDAPPETATWISGDLTYRAVSDLNGEEPEEFAALMQ